MQRHDGLTPERVLALAAVAALLLVGVISLSMILGAISGDDEPEESAVAPPAATPTATPTPKPSPTPVPLTPEQRAQRRAAADEVRRQGFSPVSLRHYEPTQTLRVLLGTPASAPEGRRRAFFFVGDQFVGTDTPEGSSNVRIRKQSETQVTLAYKLFLPDDQPCCPTAGTETVRFKWDGAAVTPRDELPSAAERIAPGTTG
jgi:LppP/LprE lipoprotein